MLDRDTAARWRGNELIDRDGDKIGTIGEIYLDIETDAPEWATVKTGLFGTKHTFVPIRDATAEGDIVRIPFEKSHVKDAPTVDPEGELGEAEERELYNHYGIDYSTSRSGSLLPETGGTPGQEPVGGGTPGGGEAGGTGGGTTGGAGSDAGAPSGDVAGEPGLPGYPGDGPADAERHVGPADAAQPGRPWTGDPGSDPAEGRVSGETERPGEDAPAPAPTPDEGERGVAVPGESDDDDDADTFGDDPEGKTVARLRLKRYVVTEEIKVPVRREEVRLEPDEGD
jgi:sporulation protein YlmC with PRC-barrel domain